MLKGWSLVALCSLFRQLVDAQRFRAEEATISEIHAAMAAVVSRAASCVSQYLARIAAYDKAGPAINAIVVVNPKALDVADSLDRRFPQLGARWLAPLHPDHREGQHADDGPADDRGFARLRTDGWQRRTPSRSVAFVKPARS